MVRGGGSIPPQGTNKIQMIMDKLEELRKEYEHYRMLYHCESDNFSDINKIRMEYYKRQIELLTKE